MPRAVNGEKVVVEPFCEALEREYPSLIRMARNEDQVMLALRQLKIQPNTPGQVHQARLEDLEEVADATVQAFIEQSSGQDPRALDPEGFTTRHAPSYFRE